MEKQRARPAREWWEPCLGGPPRIDWVVDQKRRSVTTYRTLPALVRIAISRNAIQPCGTVGVDATGSPYLARRARAAAVDVGLVAVLVGIGAGCSLAHAGNADIAAVARGAVVRYRVRTHAGSGSTHPGHVTLILRLASHAVAVVDLAVGSAVARRANAAVAVDVIDAGSPVLAGARGAVVDVRATIRRAVDESVAARAFGATLESRVLPTAPHHRAEWSSRVAMSKSPPNASSAVLKRSVPRHCQRDDGRMTLSLSPRCAPRAGSDFTLG